MSQPTLLDRHIAVIAEHVANRTAEHETHVAYWPNCLLCKLDLATIEHERAAVPASAGQERPVR